MNVLILTPDRVGSTLLQRLVTVYMLRQSFDRPVINLHELTNGLIKYYNTELNQEVLGKPKQTDWGYFQNLDDITQLLKSVDHYKTSRLAHYHIIKRQDSLADQLKFYEYLNNNFFIISCRRTNIFEHCLSWGIQAHSKKLNVYSAIEKVDFFSEIYKTGITISAISFLKYLEDYKKYVEWSDRYFNIQSIFDYDKDIHNIEDYILNLDFLKRNKNNSWEAMFGQSFANFNTCHKILPDLLLKNNFEQQNKLAATGISSQRLTFDDSLVFNTDADMSDEKTNNYIDVYKTNNQITVNEETAFFLKQNYKKYKETVNSLEELVDKGFLVTTVPIKLQSLKEKKDIIKNFKELMNLYNQWVQKNNFGEPYTEDRLQELIIYENSKLEEPLKLMIPSDNK